MGKMDNLTREKIREWQIRRLELKDQMQTHPERTLELSRVLDLMDEEHATILAGATISPVDGLPATDRTKSPEPPSRRCAGRFNLQLHVATHSLDDLSKLFEIAAYELHKLINRNDAGAPSNGGTYPGGMSGTLGDYHFELRVNDEGRDE